MSNEQNQSPFKAIGTPTTETGATSLTVEDVVENGVEHEHPAPSELSVLKARAKLMGITFSNNISLESLKAKVDAKMAEDNKEDKEDEVEDEAVLDKSDPNQPTPGPVKISPVQQIRIDLHNEQMKLVRVRITCMNPQKADLHGEIVTVANEYVGTVRKFVPFGEDSDNGYHIPFILYTALEERRYQQIMTIKDPKTGHLRTRTKDAKEFSIEVLPPLTERELKDLAVAQIAAGSIDAGTDGEYLS